MENDPVIELEAGIVLLSSLLSPRGFEAVIDRAGNSCGGDFASGYFQKGRWKLELHFRRSLGHVLYWFGDNSISHDEYMHQVVPDGRIHLFPPFGEEPRDGFEALRRDLDSFAFEFVECMEQEFLIVLAQAAANPKPKGFGALGAP